MLALVACEESTPVGDAGVPRPTAQDLHAVALTRLDGTQERLSLYGGRSVIVNVWATWCAPCRGELPSLDRLSRRLDPERFVLVGLAVDQDPDFVREYLNDIGVAYPNYIDSRQTVVRDLLGLESFPQTLLVDGDGVLRGRIVGARDWDHPDAVAALVQVAGE
jgi:thiol-disulfide isomerase/thioredoxin